MMIVVTSRPSRAWVHSAWIVYMAEPSASREIDRAARARRPPRRSRPACPSRSTPPVRNR